MNRLMIGQFDKFDSARQKRDFRDYFWGIEVNQMDSVENLEELKTNIKKHNLNFGIHFPLLKNQWRSRDPQYLSKDCSVYEESIKYMESEFARAMELNPDYILLHYPKPVILDDSVDWSCWRFYDSTEYYYESEMSFEFFEDKSRNFFKILSEFGERYNFTPILELDGLNKYIYGTTLLEDLLEEYPNIKLCLDFGRIHLQDCIDTSFNGLSIIKKFGKFTCLVHLWNCQVSGNGHYPALKSLNGEDGWGDMDAYFRLLNEVNTEYKVLFEHKSNLISETQLEECYKWVKEVIEEKI